MTKTESYKTIQVTDIRPGMVVRVHQKIKEINPKGEEKERIQIFEGMIIKHRGGQQPGATFTVRKISDGIGVEKIIPLFLPSIAKIEAVKQYQTRRAKLYYTRTYPKKMKEVALRISEMAAPAKEAPVVAPAAAAAQAKV